MNKSTLMNIGCMLLASVLAGSLFAASPSVSLVSVASHDPWDGRFDVSYTLTGVDAATDYKVAFDVTAGGQTAGITNAAARLADGACDKTLDTVALFGKTTTDAKATVRVSLIAVKPKGTSVPDVTGTPVGALGDVMIVDVSGGSAAETYPVAYVSGADLGTFNCDVYKTTKIVLRKVAKGTACAVKPGATDVLDVADAIAPAKDYYIGVFPVTEAQYARVTGGESDSTLPKASVSWRALRGDGVTTVTEITSATAAGFFQKLCAKCHDSSGPVAGFDLPTEVQWEIAARAGSTAPYGTFLKDLVETAGTSENVSQFAVFGGGAAAVVGSKCPNVWGLFDMAGNVAEWCRDDYVASGSWTDAETPKSVAESELKVIRGGSFGDTASTARLTNRNNLNAGDFSANARTGFRLVKICK